MAVRPSLVCLMDAVDGADDLRMVDALRARCDVTVLHPGTIGGLEVRLIDGTLRCTLAGRALLPDVVLPWRIPTSCQHRDLAALEQDGAAARFHRLQWATMLRGLVMAWELAGTPVVNGSWLGRWNEKTAQVVAAAAAGFATVPTLQSANGAGIRSFLDEVDGPAIHKSFVPVHRYDPASRTVVRTLTRALDRREIDARYDALVPTPSLFQPLVPAATEVRVAVIGDVTFAAAIDRDRLDHVDSRACEAADLPAAVHVLSAVEEAACRSLVRRCGLQVATIDLLPAEGGPPAFLDLNPFGIFDWIPARFGLPAYEALADLVADLATPVAS